MIILTTKIFLERFWCVFENEIKVEKPIAKFRYVGLVGWADHLNTKM